MTGRRDGYALGVDLGTSNTVAVLRHPDGRTRPLLVEGEPIMPSGVYADPDGRLHVGRDARRLAQADPGRYEPNPKRHVDESAVRLGDRDHAPAELFAAILGAVATAAVEAVGFLPPAVVTCPATWDDARRQVLADALLRAGWPSAAEHTLSGPIPDGTRLLREPVAAARYYTRVLRRPVPVGSSIAVFDLGGGTLDVTVVRNDGADPWGDSGFTVLATGGADFGGLDLDAALVAVVGEQVAGADPALWGRLTGPRSTGERRDQIQLWEQVRGAKEMLSRALTAPVAVPGREEVVVLTRDDLDRVAAPLADRAVAVTREVIGDAGLTPAGLGGLFLVGGGSRVPLVARLLHAGLGVSPTVLDQPELPVAEGALTDLPTPRGVPAAAGPVPAPAWSPPTPTPAPDWPPSPPHPTAAWSPSAPASPAPTAPASPAPTGHLPPAPTLVGPGGSTYVPYQPAVGPPAGPPPGPGAPRRALWITAAALVALAGVVGAAVVLLLTREPHPDLEFRAFEPVGRITTGEQRPATMLTAVLGDRSYLAYTLPDSRLRVVAVDAGTGDQVWDRETATTARWNRIEATSGVVAVFADTTDPRTVLVLDARTGEQRWERSLQREDEVLLGSDRAVLVDRSADRLVGLDLRDGSEVWTRDSPRTSSGGTRTRVYPVVTADESNGPASADGRPAALWSGDERRLVQVGADRSVRVVDVRDGSVVRDRPNVARPDDTVVVTGDRMYVAADGNGYRLEAYDLGKLGEPVILYSAGENRRPRTMTACGEHRVCLLEVADHDAETTEVVAVEEGSDPRRWAASGATTLLPFGEHLLASRTSPEESVTLFDPQGRALLTDRGGVGVRLDAGNLLVFAKQLGSFESDSSVAGVWARSGGVTELGLLTGVRSGSCSWNDTTIVCGARQEFVLHRFAG
ncbi:Hsp70 family protein [Micromonospora sp. SH-82]|uniref:Hsp70 family protein n=1 Tax=Micromonospora sp. SH-82 TaxID=3132938 RepID=UPI003EBAA071